jgi:SRSO17 transposase
MDAKQIRQLKPMLTRYLKQFDACFGRRDTRAHFSTYIEGQLSDLGEKSCEPIALAAGIPPRNLQEFLSTYKWEEDRTRNRLQKIVIRDHSGRNSVGIIDETSDVKQGNKTPGVKRQWCGTVGKTENCIVTVHLAYAAADFHCLLDGDLFLPEDWSDDRVRCRAAGIRYGTAMPHQANTKETAKTGHLSERPHTLQMALTLRSKTKGFIDNSAGNGTIKKVRVTHDSRIRRAGVFAAGCLCCVARRS